MVIKVDAAAVFLACLAVSVGCQFSPKDYYRTEVHTYPIDLSMPAFERWRSLPEHLCVKLKEFEPRFTQYYIDNLFGSLDKFNEVYHYVDEFIKDEKNAEFYEELKGLVFKCKLSERYLAMYNLMYEFGQLGGCTAAAYTVEGKAYMTKNLDYNFHDFFSETVFVGRYYFHGHVLFETTQLFGFLGSTTYSREGVTSTLNARFWGHRSGMESFMASLKDKSLNMTLWTTRDIFFKHNRFEDIVQSLRDVQHMAPAYYTVVDEQTGSAAVVTRGFAGESSVEFMKDWFIVQTNADRHVMTELRRHTAEKKFGTIQRSENIHQTVFDEIMSQSPNFMTTIDPKHHDELKFRTISTSIYDPVDKKYKVYAWKLRPTTLESEDLSEQSHDLRL